MTEISYEKTSEHWDAQELLATLRDEDRVELEIGTGKTAEIVLMESIFSSEEVMTLRVDGDLLAIIGLADAGEMEGLDAWCPWLIGSTAIDDHKRAFMIVTRSIVNKWMRQHEYLCNFVHADSKASKRWLEWLGFTIMPAVPFGPNEAMFNPFYMERGD